MDPVEVAGYLAIGCVLFSSGMRLMIPLRVAWRVGNGFFIV